MESDMAETVGNDVQMCLPVKDSAVFCRFVNPV